MSQTTTTDSAALSKEKNEKTSVLAAPYRALTIGIILAVTTVAFEGLAVTTIAPRLVEQLQGMALYGWIFSAFLLAQIIGTMVTGGQVDRKGVFRPFIWGISLFVTGILVAALAVNMYMLIAGRLFQGLGAGAIVTCIYYSITMCYPDKLRPKILAAFSSAYILPSLIGPYFAGVLAEYASWRFVFWLVLPLIALAVFLTVPTFRNIGKASAFGNKADQRERRELQAVILAAGTGLLLTGLGMIATIQGMAVTIIGAAILSAPLRKLLPEGTLRLKRGFPAIIAARGLYFACYIAVESYIVLAFTALKGYSADAAGLIVAAGSLAWSFAAWLQSRFDEKDGGRGRKARITIGIGIMLAGVALVLITVAVPGTGIIVAASSQVLAGFGIGFANPTVGAVALQHASKDKAGEVSSYLQFVDSFGPGLSVGLGGALIGIGKTLEWGLYTGILLAIALQLVFLTISFIASLRMTVKEEG